MQVIQQAFDKAEANGYQYTDSFYIPTAIYTHAFAKALWGDEPVEWEKHLATDFLMLEESYIKVSLPAWAAHLLFMTMSKDPVKYLEENI